MKKLFILVLSSMAIFACGHKTSSNSTATTTDSSSVSTSTAQDSDSVSVIYADTYISDGSTPYTTIAAIKNTVNQIYNDIAKEKTDDDIIQRYGRSDLQKLWEANNNANQDGVGDIDWDVFTNSQDNSNLSFRIKSITLIKEDSALADIAVSTCGIMNIITLYLSQEDDGWKIFDISSSQNGQITNILAPNN